MRNSEQRRVSLHDWTGATEHFFCENCGSEWEKDGRTLHINFVYNLTFLIPGISIFAHLFPDISHFLCFEFS